MAKSSNLSYPAPFRYRRPGEDLQAVFGAQTSNPRVVSGESAKPAKPSTVKKKSPSAAAGKSSKAAKAKPTKVVASKKAKAKKPAGKR